MATVLGGGAPANRIYARTTATGVSLATVAGGTYLQETYAGSLRTYGDGNRISISQLDDVMRRSYPQQMRNGTFSSPPGAQQSNIFLANVDHSHGHLSALVDRGEGRVFKESQRLALSRSLAGPAVSATASGLRITVNRTYSGGALRVRVVDARTGRPVEATVTYPPSPEARPVLLGTTAASNGTLWTPSPGGEFRIQTLGDRAAASVRIDSMSPPSVSDDRRASGDAPAAENDSASPAPSNETSANGSATDSADSGVSTATPTATPAPTSTETPTPTPTETSAPSNETTAAPVTPAPALGRLIALPSAARAAAFD